MTKRNLKLGNFKYVKFWNDIFEARTAISPCGNERVMRRDGGRILLGDSTGSRAVIQQPTSSQWKGVWISTGFSCVYIYLTMCLLISDLRRNFRKEMLWKSVNICTVSLYLWMDLTPLLFWTLWSLMVLSRKTCGFLPCFFIGCDAWQGVEFMGHGLVLSGHDAVVPTICTHFAGVAQNAAEPNL